MWIIKAIVLLVINAIADWAVFVILHILIPSTTVLGVDIPLLLSAVGWIAFGHWSLNLLDKRR
jgi:hypothetical protein